MKLQQTTQQKIPQKMPVKRSETCRRHLAQVRLGGGTRLTKLYPILFAGCGRGCGEGMPATILHMAG